jgi:hypothetical protein
MDKLDWDDLWTEAMGRASWAKHPTRMSRMKAEQYDRDSKLRDRWNHQIDWIKSKLNIEDFDLPVSRVHLSPKSNYWRHFFPTKLQIFSVCLLFSMILDSIRYPQITFAFFSVCN